jgi:hypothetical protein
MKERVPTKEQIEEKFGYSIHEASSRLDIGIHALKELCRSYNIPRWPRYRKTRRNSDLFQSFSVIQKEKPTENKPKSISKQTKSLMNNVEQQVHLSPQNKEIPLEIQLPETESIQFVISKMSINNLCN